MSADIESRALAGDVPAQIEVARRLEQEGRNTEAVDWLARAAKSGDAQALTLLGLKLLTGQNAPFLPVQGAGLLSDAVKAGGAEAAEHLAVLVGGGLYARQSWQGALDLLWRASELGSAGARRQLAVLMGENGGVDLQAWTSAKPVQVLRASPRVLAIEGLIPEAACDWVIEQSRSRLVRAELYDAQTGKPMASTETRLNRIANFGLADTNLLNLLIQARISASVGVALNQMEAFAVLNYAPGEEYGEHHDYLDPAIPAYRAEIERMGQRIATCLVYLNQDYEGGQTEFPQLGLSYRGGKGDALVFFGADPAGAPDPRTVHAGRPPTSGEKWLLSQFIRNRPVIGFEARPN